MTAIRTIFVLALFTAAFAALGQPPVDPSNPAAYQINLRDSRWLATEMDQATAALAKTPVDVLVVPFQVAGDSFDATERSLLARTVAAALRERAGLRVADLTLVERALGSSARRVPEPTIGALATRVGARTVVLGRIGHDNAGHYDLLVELLTVENGAVTSRRPVLKQTAVTFGHANPPYFSFRAHVDTIVAAIGGKTSTASGLPARGTAVPQMPASIQELEEVARRGGVPQAYLLQFLGVLYPTQTQGRDRFALFERSLIALEGVPETPATRVLRARAWTYLNRRPLALAALKTSSTAENAMSAFLDGDIERLTAAVKKIDEPLPRLLATFELERARAAYGRAADTDLAEALVEQHPFWAPLLAQALALTDAWGDRSPAVVKLGLDRYWTLPQYDLEAAFRAAMALQKPPSEYDIAKLANDHINAASASWPTALDGVGPGPSDVAQLLRQMLVAIVVDSLEHTTSRIGRPEAAMAKAAMFEPLLSGQPNFVLARGWAEFGQAEKLEGSAAAELKASGYAHLREGALWSQGQTWSSEIVLTIQHQFFPGSDRLSAEDRARAFFGSDWPNLPGWGWRSSRSDDDRRRNLEHCVAYTTQSFQCFLELHSFLTYKVNADAAAKLVADHRHRFIGHPSRIDFFASIEREAGNDTAANAVLDEAIAAGSMDWDIYDRRGSDLAKLGKPREALAVFLKYPGFRDGATANRVTLSNHAYEAGSLLYWAGAYDEARPLYEFAAGLATGSEASITSAVRLALLDHDFETAVAYTADRARRYGSKYALRDLMMFVAALGDRDTAWAIFNTMEQEIDKPDFWLGALAIQRMEGVTLEAAADWAFQGARSEPRTNTDSLAMRHVFLLHVTDREITDALAETLRTRDPGPHLLRDRWGFVRFSGQTVFASHHWGDPAPQQTSTLPSTPPIPEQRLDNRLAVMSRALAALQRKDYESAFATFDEASHTYTMDEFLPYYAWAAVHVGKTERIERYLASVRRTKEQTMRIASSSLGTLFDEYLSLAALHGYRGEVDVALDYLVKTNADVLHTESRAMFTRYQIAEVAELLYEHTGEARYRTFMLDLARRNALIDPAFSWPHAFVAKYSDDTAERRVALARALYLDPMSRRAARASAAEIAAAKRLIQAGSPFLSEDNPPEA